MNHKMLFFILIVLLLLPVCISAQTAAFLEEVLAADKVTCGQAAYFVLEGTSNAFQQAAEKGWLKAESPDTPITLSKLSHLLMQAYEMKGGLMYMIFPGPRYAYRTMVNRRFITGTADPGMTVNGERFLQILGNVLAEIEAEEAAQGGPR